MNSQIFSFLDDYLELSGNMIWTLIHSGLILHYITVTSITYDPLNLSSKLTVRPWQIGVGRLVSINNCFFFRVYVNLPEG